MALTDEEFRTLAKLLSRFAEEELDQWEHWRISTVYGDVYVDIHRMTTLDREVYDDLGRWLD